MMTTFKKSEDVKASTEDEYLSKPPKNDSTPATREPSPSQNKRLSKYLHIKD